MTSNHDGADPDIRRLAALLEDKGPEASADELRAAFRAFVQRVEAEGSAPAHVARIHDTTLPGDAGPIPVRIYEPADTVAETADCFVYMHGGGWVLGDLDTGDLGARALAAGLGIRLVSVHYRLAPEHPFPAPLDDCLSVLRAVRSATTGSVYVGGESAGANLAAALAVICRDEGMRLAGQFLINPSLDSRPTSDSHRRFGSGEGLTTEAVIRFYAFYAGGADLADPRIAPLYTGSLAGVAPCFLTTAGFDPLRDDGAAYAQRLIAADVPTVYLPMPTMMHAWWAMLTASSEAKRNLDRMLGLAAAFVAIHR